jgi:hypothetical protein
MARPPLHPYRPLPSRPPPRNLRHCRTSCDVPAGSAPPRRSGFPHYGPLMWPAPGAHSEQTARPPLSPPNRRLKSPGQRLGGAAGSLTTLPSTHLTTTTRWLRFERVMALEFGTRVAVVADPHVSSGPLTGRRVSFSGRAYAWTTAPKDCAKAQLLGRPELRGCRADIPGNTRSGVVSHGRGFPPKTRRPFFPGGRLSFR